MDEEEALRNYCRAMIVRVQNKLQRTVFSEVEEGRRHERKEGKGRERTEPERQGAAARDLRDQIGCILIPSNRERSQTSLDVVCQGFQVQPVLLALISRLRFKTVTEEMGRAAEVELHDPAVCAMCVSETASLALKTFIRKKTQLQFQSAKSRLNTNLNYGLGDVKDRPTLSK